MKCHLCNHDLTPLPYNEWKLKNRKSVEYRCNSPDCVQQDSVIINIVLPEMEVVYYSIPLQIKGLWYELYSRNSDSPLTELARTTVQKSSSSFSRNNTVIVRIDRYYALDVKQDIKTQAEQIYHKLQTLNIFS